MLNTRADTKRESEKKTQTLPENFSTLKLGGGESVKSENLVIWRVGDQTFP